MIIAIHERYKDDIASAMLVAALSGMAILGKKKKSLVVQIKERAKYDIENININLADLRDSMNDNELEIMEEGIEVFLREANIQTPARNEFMEFADNMLNEKGKYDVVSGFKTWEYEHEFNRQQSAFENFLAGARTVYDEIFILTGYSDNSDTIKNVDRLSDVSVYCTTQYAPARKVYADKSFIAIPEYYPESSFTLRSVGKKYGQNMRVFGIRQNITAMDCAYKGQFLPYLHAHKNATEYANEYKWIMDVKGMLDVLLGEKESLYITEDLFENTQMGVVRLQAVKKLRAVEDAAQSEYMKNVSMFKKELVTETEIILGEEVDAHMITPDGFEEKFSEQPLTEEFVFDKPAEEKELLESELETVLENVEESYPIDENALDEPLDEGSAVMKKMPVRIPIVDRKLQPTAAEEGMEDVREENNENEKQKDFSEDASKANETDDVEEAFEADDFTRHIENPDLALDAEDEGAAEMLEEVMKQVPEDEEFEVTELPISDLTNIIADEVYGKTEVPFVRKARITAIQAVLYELAEKNRCLPQDIRTEEITVFVKSLNVKNFKRAMRSSQAAFGSVTAFDMVVTDKRQKAEYIQQLSYIASMMWSNNYAVVGDFAK